MKFHRSLLAAAAAVVALAAPAHAVTTSYNVQMTGIAEAPPNSSTALGQALVTFNDVALSMTVNESYVGLTGGTVTGAHIHCCTAAPGTGTAPVFVDFMSSGFPELAPQN